MGDRSACGACAGVYVGGDIRTSDTKMTVVAMMLQPGEWEEVARVLVEVLGAVGQSPRL